MITVQVMYPAGGSFDWDYYLETHMPMADRELRPIKWSVLRGTNAAVPPTYAAIAVMTFKDSDTWETNFAKAGPALLADIPKYTDVTPVIQVSEIIVPA